MATTKIIRKSDLSIVSSYEGSPNQSNYGGQWGNSNIHVHVEVPEGVEIECAKAQLDGNGNIEIVTDQERLQAKILRDRKNKLDLIREQREEKLKEMDYMAIDVALGIRADASTIATYKQDLLSMTDEYKDEEGNPTDSLDLLEDDLSNLNWPIKP